ncbi:putative photosynthetic complex assembly protein [Litoreibacter ponti]|uniref:Putative photosynthetic complex assembly protein n=1 Tax=Litoreibacter ponti TaxID=1510457 RepID=A0A2T6BPM5_9RHOB|nr:photosynthetic complex assembly protein PuhC [Litoreibacter ponti]PTX57984.1 putative photosynthetic complex assembly protein [Litoreibacter ponti]
MRDIAGEKALVQRDKEMIPTRLLLAMVALVAIIFSFVVYAAVTDRPLEAGPPDLAIVKEREISIVADMSGAARVMTPEGALIADLSADEGGFVSGIGRVLHRERGKVGKEASAPIRLIQYSDGRLAIRDDHTTWRAELRGFGQDNEATFYRILNAN